MEKIKIGRVVNATGLKGELKIYPFTETQERFGRLKRIFVGDEPAAVESVRFHGEMVILKIEGIGDRTGAEARKGKDVFMDAKDLEAPPAGTYYVRDLLGMDAEDMSRGRVGVLMDVRGGVQSHFVIRRDDGREFLVPAVEAFFTGVDWERKVILLELIEGMYED